MVFAPSAYDVLLRNKFLSLVTLMNSNQLTCDATCERRDETKKKKKRRPKTMSTLNDDVKMNAFRSVSLRFVCVSVQGNEYESCLA